MDAALILAGLAMGVASSPHCAAMCGAPCAALAHGCKRSAAGFHLGRVLGYMAAGAVAASSVALFGAWSQAAPALRPLWALLHLAFLALGLWWLATGRQPNWMKRGGAVPAPVSVHWLGRHQRPLRSAATGMAWVAWPCGALQAGLLLAALANSATGGALVMAGFALGSAPALAAAPWMWARWRAIAPRSFASTASPAALAMLGFRIAGAGLVLASGWALTHGLWQRFAAWCLA